MNPRDLYRLMGVLAALRWASRQAEGVEDHEHVAALVEFIVPHVGRALDAMCATRTGLFDDDESEADGDD